MDININCTIIADPKPRKLRDGIKIIQMPDLVNDTRESRLWVIFMYIAKYHADNPVDKKLIRKILEEIRTENV